MRVRAPRFEAALPSRVKGYFPRGPKFFTTGNIAFPLIGRSGEYCGFSNGFYCEVYCAGLKGAFPGPEQLARFCDIAIILLAIINIL